MIKIKFPKPDFKLWAGHETWSMNQAAFLLHGIDPLKFREVRLQNKDTPVEFEAAQSTYFALRSIPWNLKHPDYNLPNKGVHPAAVIHEATNKNLPVPALLRKYVKERFDKEILSRKNPETRSEHVEERHSEKNELKAEPLANRERNAFLKGIGLLVKLLIDEKIKSSRNASLKLSASQISQLMLEKAEHLGVETEGVKSFDRKITAAIEFINDHSDQEIDL